MPTITLNREAFEKLVGKKLSLEQLKDRISMLGTDLERIEGNEIEVEVFPNRPDMLSEQGFARAFSSFIGVKTGLRKYEVKNGGEKVIIDSSVKDVRPYTACALVKDLKIDEENIRELIRIQEKLHVTYGRNRKKLAIGIYPLEKIIFPITYRAEIPSRIKFQPLEASQEMTGLQILSHHKAGREYGHLLNGLDKFPIFIDAEHNILSMPPLINSHLTGKVTPETSSLFIECSGFDQHSLNICLNIIVTALSDLGSQVYSLELDYGTEKKVTPNLTPERMKLDLNYINRRLGLKLQEKEAKELLERMGYGYENGFVLVPAYRADILHQADLAEDIAIAYGYENFLAEIPKVSTIGAESPSENFYDKVREILVSLRLLEVKNYHLMAKPELHEKMNRLSTASSGQSYIPLKNAWGDYNHLRNSLLPSLMKNLHENRHYEYPQVIFEIGRVFNKASQEENTETGVNEQERLAVVLCHEKADFTEIKQVLDALIDSFGLQAKVKETEHPSFIPGRVGEILVKEKKIGIIGSLSPEVITNWNLTVPVVGLELNLEELLLIIFTGQTVEKYNPLESDDGGNNNEANKQKEVQPKTAPAGEFVKIDTERLFYQDPYLQEAKATVKNINGNEIILDKTLFFAFSGGQASDRGTINGIQVIDAKKENSKIVHVLEKEPDFKDNETVKLKLDWPRRYNLMKLHSAAHLVYYPFVEILGKPKIIGSNINPNKARIDFLYDQPISEKISQIETAVNDTISQNRDMTTAPDQKDPEKRWWSCPGKKMPCGGTHVRNTSEIGKIKLKRKNIGKGKERVEIVLDEA